MRSFISLAVILMMVWCISCEDCPMGWKCLGEKCYCIGYTYSWKKTESHYLCETKSATLVMPKSQEENDFIASLMPANGKIFMGLEKQPGGELEWFDNEQITATSYTNWDGSGVNQGQNCFTMTKVGDTAVWNSADCNGNVNYYLCQTPSYCTAEFTYWVEQECLIYVHEPKTWPSAEAACHSEGPGGVMASPSSEAAMEHIAMEAREWNNIIWIGLTDSEQEGSWVWSATGQAASPDNWDVSQPDNWNGKEDCAVMRANGKLNDKNCNGQAAYFCSVPFVAKRFQGF